jgi:hypothetical protein
VVRELADHQIDRYQQVMQWPLAEVLAAYEARLKRDAQQAYIVEYIAWNIRAQAGSKEKAPKLPPILQD